MSSNVNWRENEVTVRVQRVPLLPIPDEHIKIVDEEKHDQMVNQLSTMGSVTILQGGTGTGKTVLLAQLSCSKKLMDKYDHILLVEPINSSVTLTSKFVKKWINVCKYDLIGMRKKGYYKESRRKVIFTNYDTVILWLMRNNSYMLNKKLLIVLDEVHENGMSLDAILSALTFEPSSEMLERQDGNDATIGKLQTLQFSIVLATASKIPDPVEQFVHVDIRKRLAAEKVVRFNLVSADMPFRQFNRFILDMSKPPKVKISDNEVILKKKEEMRKNSEIIRKVLSGVDFDVDARIVCVLGEEIDSSTRFRKIVKPAVMGILRYWYDVNLLKSEDRADFLKVMFKSLPMNLTLRGKDLKRKRKRKQKGRKDATVCPYRQQPERIRMLIFVDTKRQVDEIVREAKEKINAPGVQFIPCYSGNLDPLEEAAEHDNRKERGLLKPLVVVSTNASESGLTVKRIGVVINSCTENRVSDKSDFCSQNSLTWCGRSSLLQRAGRGGRDMHSMHIVLAPKRMYKKIMEGKTLRPPGLLGENLVYSYAIGIFGCKEISLFPEDYVRFLYNCPNIKYLKNKKWIDIWEKKQAVNLARKCTIMKMALDPWELPKEKNEDDVDEF